jgi:hypothetical protein
MTDRAQREQVAQPVIRRVPVDVVDVEVDGGVASPAAVVVSPTDLAT